MLCRRYMWVYRHLSRSLSLLSLPLLLIFFFPSMWKYSAMGSLVFIYIFYTIPITWVPNCWYFTGWGAKCNQNLFICSFLSSFPKQSCQKGCWTVEFAKDTAWSLHLVPTNKIFVGRHYVRFGFGPSLHNVFCFVPCDIQNDCEFWLTINFCSRGREVCASVLLVLHVDYCICFHRTSRRSNCHLGE